MLTMKILKVLGIIILVIGILFLGALVIAPSDAHFEKEITINAPAKVVFTEVNNMKTFNTWSPWYKMDPDAEYLWEGPSLGVGAKQIWYSENQYVGNGYMMVSESKPNEYVALEMGFDNNGNRDFTDEGEERPQASFILTEEGESTRVKWTFDVTGVSGMEKFMNWALPMFLGPAYEEGLAALKDRIESGPQFSSDIGSEIVESVTFVGLNTVSATTDPEMDAKVGAAFGRVIGFLEGSKIEMVGSPMAVCTNFEENTIEMICGVPVAKGTSIDSKDLIVSNTPEGLVVKAVHNGAYASLQATHEKIDQYVQYYDLEVTGYPWEVYPTDPYLESDTSKWITYVYYPVK